MILQALVKYYENLAEQGKVSRLGWCHAKVSYEINLSSEGDIIGITSRKIADMRGKKVVWVPANLVVPEMVTRSSGVAANFLCDNSKYMLGIDADGTNSRVVDCFQATKEKHGQILQSAQGKTARAILAYFEKWDPQKASEHPVIRENWEELTEGGNLIFSVEGQEAQEDPEIRDCWENYRARNGCRTLQCRSRLLDFGNILEQGPCNSCFEKSHRTLFSAYRRNTPICYGL